MNILLAGATGFVGGEVPAQSQIQREFRIHPEIVLKKERVHVLPEIDDGIRAEVDDAGRAEDKIRKIIARGVAGNRASDRQLQLSAGRFAELPRELVFTIERVDVQNLRTNHHELVPHLQGVAPANHRIIKLRVERGWILELRITRLAAQLRKSADILRVQAAREIRRRWQPGNAI